MKMIAGMIALTGILALSAATIPAHAQGQASLTIASGHFELVGCSIGSTAKTCMATPLKVAAGLAYGSSCTFNAGYSGGGAQTGACSVDDGFGRTGIHRVNVRTGGCEPLTIESNGQYAYETTVRLTDGVEDRWILKSLRMTTLKYQHDVRSGQDDWVIDPAGSEAKFQNEAGRIVTLKLAGSLRSSSNCAADVSASSFIVDVVAVGPIS